MPFRKHLQPMAVAQTVETAVGADRADPILVKTAGANIAPILRMLRRVRCPLIRASYSPVMVLP